MKHLLFADATTYPIALLIKDTSFNKLELQRNYLDYLNQQGITDNQVIGFSLDSNSVGKSPVSFIKAYLTTNLLPALQQLGVTTLYVADAAYFKVLTGKRKAEPHYGYVLPCKVPGYEHMQVLLGMQYKVLLFNPALAPRLQQTLDALVSHTQGTYQAPGQGIIHTAAYPHSLTDITHALAQLHQHPRLTCDIEAASLQFHTAGIATIAFAWNAHEGISFAVDYRALAAPVDGVYGEMVVQPKLRAALKYFLVTYPGTLIWHNSPYDLKCLIYSLWMEHDLDQVGLLKGLDTLTARCEDTRIIAYLATNTTAGNKLSLKDLAHPFAGNYAQEDIKNVLRIPLPDLLEYNLVDCLSTWYVDDQYRPVMIQDQQETLYRTLMLPSQKTIIQMELTGMPMDPAQIATTRYVLEQIQAEHAAVFSNNPLIQTLRHALQHDQMEAANAKLKVKQHAIEHFSDYDFNPNSNQHLQKLLYEVLQLPVIDMTDTKQPATGAATLAKLVNHTAVPEYKAILAALIGYGKVSKILGTFIPAFERGVLKADGMQYLHGNFLLGGTVSGRLSSSSPNLQNIPSGSTYGKLIKQCFSAPKGQVDIIKKDWDTLIAPLHKQSKGTPR